jgi:hypothetical protein
MLLDPVSIDQWATDNSHCFAPPIMNKLMHKKYALLAPLVLPSTPERPSPLPDEPLLPPFLYRQLTIMFVGGPNTRTDFHVEGGSELFIMMKGSMLERPPLIIPLPSRLPQMHGLGVEDGKKLCVIRPLTKWIRPAAGSSRLSSKANASL